MKRIICRRQYHLFLLLVVSLFLQPFRTLAQVVITSSDSLNCATTCTTLTAHVTGDAPTDAGVTLDDIYSSAIPIGFTFNYYGTDYTHCLLGANGTIDFNMTDAGAYDPWPITAALNGNPSKYNNICGPWCDIDIFYTGTPVGTETYSTDGVAPYRKFAVTWCGCSMFSCGSQHTTTQIILYETTNIIEVHIAKKPVCTSWNPSSPPGAGGRAIVGVEAPASMGGVATTAPGRDFPSIWTIPPTEAWRFTPSGTGTGTTYSVSSIPYAPIPLASSAIYWYNATTGAYLGSGDTLTVCPTTATEYKAGALGCADTSFGYYTVIPSPVGPTVTLTTTNPSLCGVCDGTITLHGLTAGLSDTITYDLGGVPQTAVVAVVASDGTVTLTGLCHGTYSNFVVKQQTCYSLPAGPVTLVYPGIAITSITPTNPSLCGICDGSLVLHGLYPSHAFTVNYNFNGVPQTAVSTTTSAAGTITLTGLCAGIYSNIIASFGGCITPPAGPDTLVNPPISISGVTTANPSFCGLGNGSMVLSGLYPNHIFTINYNYNGVAQPPVTVTSSATGTITLTGLCAGVYNNIIASFGDCITPPVGPYTVTNPATPPLSVVSSVNPTQCGYCDGSITIRALTPYTTDTVYYSKDGVPQIPIVTVTRPDSTVVLTGLCKGVYSAFSIAIGECGANTCQYNVTGSANLITDTLHPAFAYTIHYGCHGDTVSFVNSSSTSPSVPLYYIWSFGDGTSDTTASPTHIFAQGTYTVSLTVTNHTCTSIEDTVISLIHPLIAAFVDTPAIVCEGFPVSFINTTTGSSLSYLWNFGDGNTDTASNPSHTYPKTGAYTVTLVATDWVPCKDTTTRVVQVDTNSNIQLLVTDTTICQGTYMTFNAVYASLGNIGVSYNFGNGDSVLNINPVPYTFQSAGTYTVTVNAYYRACNNISTSRDIIVLPQPSVSLGADTSICPGSEAIVLTDKNNSALPGTSWLWSTGETGNSITITQPGVYYVTVNINNCKSSDTITVLNDCYMSMPNVFTPNGDGINDYFFPRQLLTRGLTQFHMTIFNRWGELIFETSTLDGRGWDGKLNNIDQPEGVYVYEIDATFKDGQKEHHQGNVTLLR